MVKQDKRNNNANKPEANCHIVGSDKKIIYPNYIMDNNKLSGVAFNLPENKFIIVEEATRPIPVPRKWYRDENGVRHPIPAPRKKKGGKIPIAALRTKIDEKRKALKGYTRSFEIGIKSNFSALEQLQHERTQRLFTGSTIPRRDVFSVGS